MDEQCSIGVTISEVCHKTFNGPVSKNLKHLNNFEEGVQNLYKLRVSSSVINWWVSWKKIYSKVQSYFW